MHASATPPSTTDTATAVPRKLVIASRESRLALWQAEHVRAALQQYYPACDVSILGMTTRGDQILDRTLSKVGGKGLFVKELEVAMAEGRADLAVHSLKDVPMELPAGFTLAAVMTREDPRDALVSERFASLAEMPPGTVVGTSSLRREAALRARYPHLEIRPLRGNLDTRLAKLDRGDYGAIILAAAGLKRLGLGARIRALLAPEDSLPAAGQGALGIEIRADRPGLAAWLAPLNDNPTFLAVTAERAVSRALGGSCQVPLAAHARWDGTQLRLDAFVALPDGTRCLRASAAGPAASAAEAERLGAGVGDELLAQGAGDILAALADPAGPAGSAAAPAPSDSPT
ncbi:hydroxymethylbilane synthase [Cupriavidus sp. USMAA2-4]|uniref:hydroxymethylbilane synthase n=1 Tax=Cupriavidus sp. USMAA2-4 TaxID=876364 RepID=UPI0008A6AE38|nr:hydroxymethylbilane synthase [Cupriavidus sp. USMAA2-4]AOY92987.1 hydroxymethylbilane synthase [Cupriavidus sp. USMAA2-4]